MTSRNGLWSGLNTCWVFAFLALLIVVPWGYVAVPLVAGMTLLAGLALTPPQRLWRRLERDDVLLCAVLLAYGGLWLGDVWRTGHWPVGEGNQGILLPLWPWLAAALLVWLRRYPPPAQTLWWGAGGGALGAGAIALYERLMLGETRASNAMNAIPFGNLSLLLGMLSLMGALWCLGRGLSGRRALLALCLLGATAGVTGSLLSGTRGGWIAAPLLLLLVYRASAPLVTPALRRRLALGILAGLLAVALLPQSGVSDRVDQASRDLQQYWQDDSRATSVGLRLEMWRAGATLFPERPLAGWGEGRLEAARDRLVAKGEFPPGISRYDQLHSDMIDTTVRRGLLGLGTLLLLYGVPLWLFWRRAKGSRRDPTLGVLATAGMMVPIAFVDFGLTQSMLRDVRGLSGYLGLCIIVWVALRRSEEQEPGHVQKTDVRQASIHNISIPGS
ncbi:O-antigen ligase family protein [Halomonas piscis]|uniref:O-antigen ligase family protein n=1 Tax=Halomonas piscis TaxID=3031727 RepID=A0ABY9Z1S7_9GAMM|nr:O-antigen ligase family protein [Halomonas piscis]WNK20173.1 O-antigen ligase family protein [Halomonas piscis]